MTVTRSFPLSAGLFAIIILCLISSFHYFSIESAATLVIFNFLFVSLTFGLNGKINRKLCLLALGNVVGLLWICSLSFLENLAYLHFGEPIHVFFKLVHPILNSMWMVSFWSLSLSALPKPENTRIEGMH